MRSDDDHSLMTKDKITLRKFNNGGLMTKEQEFGVDYILPDRHQTAQPSGGRSWHPPHFAPKVSYFIGIYQVLLMQTKIY